MKSDADESLEVVVRWPGLGQGVRPQVTDLNWHLYHDQRLQYLFNLHQS